MRTRTKSKWLFDAGSDGPIGRRLHREREDLEILDLSEPPSLDQGHIERTRCFVDELVHMLSRHHQRRRNDHGVAYCPHDQTIADTDVATERAHFTRIGKGLSLVLITHEFQSADQANATSLAHQRVIFQLPPTLLQVWADVSLHAFNHTFFAQDVQRHTSHRAGSRMARVGEAMVEVAALLDERLGDPISHHDAADWQVTR